MLQVVGSVRVAHELVQVAELADHASAGVEAPGEPDEQPVPVEAAARAPVPVVQVEEDRWDRNGRPSFAYCRNLQPTSSPALTKRCSRRERS